MFYPFPNHIRILWNGKTTERGIKGSQSLTYFPGRTEWGVRPGEEVGGQPCLKVWLIHRKEAWRGQEALGRGPPPVGSPGDLSSLPHMRQMSAVCQPPPSRNALVRECPPHIPSSSVPVRLFPPWPASLRPSKPLFLISISGNLGPKLNYQQCHQHQIFQEKNTKKLTKNILMKKS